MRRGGDRDARDPALRQSPCDPGRGFARIGKVDLVQRDELRPVLESSPVASKLRIDRGDVAKRIGLRCINDVHEQARPLDVPKELLAEAETAARTLDETRNVRNDELAIVETC